MAVVVEQEQVDLGRIDGHPSDLDAVGTGLDLDEVVDHMLDQGVDHVLDQGVDHMLDQGVVAFHMQMDDDLVLALVDQDVLPLEELHVDLDTQRQDGPHIRILEIALLPIVVDSESFVALVLIGTDATLLVYMVDSCLDLFLAILLVLLVRTRLCGVS